MQHLFIIKKTLGAVLGALISAPFFAGCGAPECVSDEAYKEALAQGRAVDLLRCSGNAPLSVSASCTPNSLEVSLSDECGIFVSNSIGDDNNAGTMQSPLKSIAEAITLARVGGGARVIYLCGESFDVELVWPESGGGAGVVLFGGLKCDDKSWAYQANTKTTLSAPEGRVPLRINGILGPVNIYDMQIEAKSALASNFGGSSIALMVNEATLSLYRSLVIAGDGAPGISGMSMGPAQGGINGNAGANLCVDSSPKATAAPMLDCGGGVISAGGLGGSGDTYKGWDGTAGTPGTLNNAGLGEPESGGSCADGGIGEPGMSGVPGASAGGLGTLDWTVGFTGTWGETGQPGLPGQGGGGGGGRDNPGACQGDNGPAGGSGGTGGCGGVGGSGGGPGGVSLGVVSLRSSLTLSATQVQTGNGGASGSGSPGQEGGSGGIGGLGGESQGTTNDGCKGGDGGKGGNGGNGGNGLGGHSIGIAYTGAQAPQFLDGSSILQLGMAGEGGVVEDMQSF